MKGLFSLCACLIVAFGCATGRAIPTTDGPNLPVLGLAPDARQKVVATAQSLLGQRRIALDGKRFGSDCTSLVQAAFSPVGLRLLSKEAHAGDNGVTAMWRFAAAHGRLFSSGRPLPGDLIFFRHTYDQNRDGRLNDGLTHVAVVEDVELDGTVVFIHRSGQGVVRERMNLHFPTLVQNDEGKRINDWLRSGQFGHSPQLSAELFVSYATLLPVEPRWSAR